MEKELDILKKIQKVEASPYMYSRILNVIHRKKEDMAPKKWVIAAVALILIVVAFNFISIQENVKNSTPNLTDVFNIKFNNMLYDE